uniref:Methyltransferase FkbM domain-containing protein n=1 Tax=Noctiluca scintillans TaxID=2966 RepID=A0A7S1AKR5_NOCSC|mmetsp:Transcript_50393/g.133874  ORF Transcript_50393/g.133874 Transcript_50393/m.133874 type:complete len:282 (+) Transcript_50393:70-915(+)
MGRAEVTIGVVCSLLLLGLIGFRATRWSSKRVCGAGEDCQTQTFQVLDRLAAGRYYAAKSRGEHIQTDLDRLLQRALKERVGQRGGIPAIVWVGANDSTGWSEVEDYKGYTGIVAPRAVFVEPNPLLLLPLQSQLLAEGANLSQVTIVNAIICANNEQAVSFDAVSPSVGAEAEFLRGNRKVGTAKTAVRCITPHSMLVEAQLEPAGVDALHIDGEGDDARILEMFLAVDNIDPAYIQFEFANMAAADQQRLMTTLTARKYDIHVVGPNLAAVKKIVGAEL